MKTSLYNIFLRGLTLVSKFVFIIFLGKYSVDEINLGVFGILTTSIALLIYIIGFDFYVFNTREIISSTENRVEKIKDQLFLHLIVYLAIIPISLFAIFKLEFLTTDYLLLLMVLLISEHLGQELYRLLTTLEKPITANLMLFLRSGLWVWLVMIDYFILRNPINLHKYISIWAVLSWLSFLIFGLFLIRKLKIRNWKYQSVNWKWIGLGIKTASVFFIGSLSFQVIQFSDRFMIDYFFDKKMVGVYTAYAQFTNAIDVFTFSAVTMIFYPKLLRSFGQKHLYSKVKSQFTQQLVIISLVIIAMVVLIAPLIFKFLEKESFMDEMPTFYILIVGIFLLITSNIYHYDLYVKKKDTVILLAAAIGMVVNVGLNLVLIPIYDIYGAAMATLISFSIILVLKFYYSKFIFGNDTI